MRQIVRFDAFESLRHTGQRSFDAQFAEQVVRGGLAEVPKGEPRGAQRIDIMFEEKANAREQLRWHRRRRVRCHFHCVEKRCARWSDNSATTPGWVSASRHQQIHLLVPYSRVRSRFGANPHPKPLRPSYAMAAESEDTQFSALGNEASSGKPAGQETSPAAPPPAPGATEWGPYTEKRFLIADILRQLSENSFARGENWPGISYKNAANSIIHYRGEIKNGAELQRNVGGIGKGIAICIDRILANKSFTTRDGQKTWYPRGDVIPPEDSESESDPEREKKEQAKSEREARMAKRTAAKGAGTAESESVQPQAEEAAEIESPSKKRKQKQSKSETTPSKTGNKKKRTAD